MIYWQFIGYKLAIHRLEAAKVASDGEPLNSKFFCNLEKCNALQKYIPELKVKDKNNKDLIIKEQTKIDKELYKFYHNLYKSQEQNQGPKTIEQLLEQDNFPHPSNETSHPKLTKKDALKLDGLFTVDEATKYMTRLLYFSDQL